MATSAKRTNNLGAGLLNSTINTLLKEYQYTSNSGSPLIKPRRARPRRRRLQRRERQGQGLPVHGQRPRRRPRHGELRGLRALEGAHGHERDHEVGRDGRGEGLRPPERRLEELLRPRRAQRRACARGGVRARDRALRGRRRHRRGGRGRDDRVGRRQRGRRAVDGARRRHRHQPGAGDRRRVRPLEQRDDGHRRLGRARRPRRGHSGDQRDRNDDGASRATRSARSSR